MAGDGWMEEKDAGGAVGRGKGDGGETKRQSLGDEGLKLIWINTNTSSPPLSKPQISIEASLLAITMTTSVNHTVAVDFQTGTNGAG